MDNYNQNCPALMSDGRFLTDYRSATVREQLFRLNNGLEDENKARTVRIDNAEQILDNEWKQMMATQVCNNTKYCYNTNPLTRTTTHLNNAKILAYNGMILAPECKKKCGGYRLTDTIGSQKESIECKEVVWADEGYPLKHFM